MPKKGMKGRRLRTGTKYATFRTPMAKTKNAKKAQRASLRKRVFNLRRKKAIHDTVKAVTAGGKEAAQKLPALYQALDKAAKNGTINKNKAARMKSRLTKRVAALAK